jgi:cytidylate kinase
MSPGSDRFVEALARLHRYAESHPAPRPEHLPPPLTVALSRQAGSGGADIARAVGARLGWPVYDHELLTRVAEEKGLHSKLLEHLDEHSVSWLEDMFQSFSSHPAPTEMAYIKALLELLVSLGKAGHCVIVGRGAAQVLPPDTTLRLRVIAPREVRIANIARSKDMTPDQAERWVDHTDRERTRFVERHFHRNATDPMGYDLILNSGRLSVEQCATLVVSAAQMLEERLKLQHVPVTV